MVTQAQYLFIQYFGEVLIKALLFKGDYSIRQSAKAFSKKVESLVP